MNGSSFSTILRRVEYYLHVTLITNRAIFHVIRANGMSTREKDIYYIVLGRAGKEILVTAPWHMHLQSTCCMPVCSCIFMQLQKRLQEGAGKTVLDGEVVL